MIILELPCVYLVKKKFKNSTLDSLSNNDNSTAKITLLTRMWSRNIICLCLGLCNKVIEQQLQVMVQSINPCLPVWAVNHLWAAPLIYVIVSKSSKRAESCLDPSCLLTRPPRPRSLKKRAMEHLRHELAYNSSFTEHPCFFKCS